nr:ribonuclease H-like domain-containing protein [Tanacetum cinerariifolium]
MAFLSSPGSTNEVNTASIQVSAVSTPVNLEQIYEDDLKEMDLKWQLALLSMRARSSRKTVNVKDASSKAIVAIYGACFNWSYMADDKVPTNTALMAFSDSEDSKSVYVDTSNEIEKVPDALIIKDWVSDIDEDESEEMVLKSDNFQHKPEQANQPRKDRLMLLSPQHAGFGDLKLKSKIMSPKTMDHTFVNDLILLIQKADSSQHMTRNISYLTDFKKHDGGYVPFGGGAKGGKITSKGAIKTGKLDFEDVYFVKELQFNLFIVSQMCDKKNNVLFTDTECFVLSPNFKLADESQVLLNVPRKNNMYSFDMKNIVPQKDLTCLLAKATNDESML